jgi:DNA repair photolyase
VDSRELALFEHHMTRVLPNVGTQSDIAYYESTARAVLNNPEATGMGYWSVNPYIGCAFGCAYCYARYAHRYAMERSGAKSTLDGALARDAAVMPPWLAFERRIFVKHNAPARLRQSLRQGSARHLGLVQGEAIVIGTATDPYQPAERRFRLTRGILEVVSEHPGLRIVIITKSPLITRDVDVLTRITRHSSLSIHLSLITLDRELARRLEPRAPTPEARLRALARLRGVGLDVGINVMPVLPGITDAPAGLDALVARVAALGATHVNTGTLRLQAEARKRYLPFIDQEFPHLAARYRAAYAHESDVSTHYRDGLHRFLSRVCRKHHIPLGRPDRESRRPPNRDVESESQLGLVFN